MADQLLNDRSKGRVSFDLFLSFTLFGDESDLACPMHVLLRTWLGTPLYHNSLMAKLFISLLLIQVNLYSTFQVPKPMSNAICNPSFHGLPADLFPRVDMHSNSAKSYSIVGWWPSTASWNRRSSLRQPLSGNRNFAQCSAYKLEYW
jgi:hypothetical protein